MENQLPKDFTMRAPTLEDAQAVTDLVIAVDVDESGEPGFSLDDLNSMWQRKHFNLATDAWMIFAPDGTLAGYADMHLGGGIARLNNVSGAHPSFKNLGIQEWILETAENWVREQFPE